MTFTLPTVLTLLYLSLLPLPSSSQSTQPGCFLCPITSCAGVLPNRSSLTLQVPLTSLGTGAQFCAALNLDLTYWVRTAPSQACVAQVATFACGVMASVNATETNCNASSIGQGVPGFGQQFTAGCEQELGCLSALVGTELVAFHACDNLTAFLDALPVMAALIPAPVSSSAGNDASAAASTHTVWSFVSLNAAVLALSLLG